MDPLIVAAINRLLRRNSWAPEQLRGFAGKTVCFDCVPVKFALTVLPNGEVAAAEASAPDVTIGITPGVMFRLLARDDTVWKEIEMSGDAELAAAVNQVWRNLNWDVEEDLALVFGDIVAHRIVEAGRTLDQWRARSVDNLARSFAEYWTEEQPLIARARDVEQFNRDVDHLRDDIARLEKRLEHLLNHRQDAKAANQTG
jgi:ubiquinone biosynthesis protein UbiJ